MDTWVGSKPGVAAIVRVVATVSCLVALSWLLLASCGNAPVAPPAGADTTNYDFTSTSYTIGEFTSILYDVAIVNDTLAYAVGEIYEHDEQGEVIQPFYNIAKWDGRKWSVERAKVLFQGDSITATLYGVFPLSPDDIWLSGGPPIHGDGTRWKVFDLVAMGILQQHDGSQEKIWGREGHLYFAGSRGTVAYFDGENWKRIETGTRVSIQDVWGATDPTTGEEVVLCAVSEIVTRSDHKILRLYPDGRVDSIPWLRDKVIQSIWFQGPGKIFTAGDGAFIRNGDGSWTDQSDVMPLGMNYSFCVRGQAENDVFVAMAYGGISHFNGRSWRSWKDPFSLVYERCAYKGDLFMAAGHTADQRGIVTIMRRIRK